MTFEPIRKEDYSMDLLKTVMGFCVDYIRRSKDSQFMPLQLAALAETAALRGSDDYQFWLLKESGAVTGYAVTEIIEGVRGHELHIRQAYVGPEARQDNAQKMTLEVMEGYAKSRACKYVTSQTRRQPFEAYLKWMGRYGYKPRSVEVEKEI